MRTGELFDEPDTFRRLALDAMRTTGPTPLAIRIEMEAKLAGVHLEAAEELLLDALVGPVGDNELAARLRTELAQWDAVGAGDWERHRAPNEFTSRVDLLAAGTRGPDCRPTHGALPSRQFRRRHHQQRARSLVPTVARRSPAYYWAHYATTSLASVGRPRLSPASGLAATRVVERLADPERPTAFQSKGLVVGYVQSGKTANFTGVIAKAIDAGYRLVIVLTGTTDLLRAQTQRRIDKELVGKENLLRGVDVT